ncbi:unnamed protein product [marine sediment metagenome]|uniref:Uncharacterized protein n=1 Tax=marine sediment metagenome TaxID=412755 RepID=X0YFQ9_9ZZZZ
MIRTYQNKRGVSFKVSPAGNTFFETHPSETVLVKPRSELSSLSKARVDEYTIEVIHREHNSVCDAGYVYLSREQLKALRVSIDEALRDTDETGK